MQEQTQVNRDVVIKPGIARNESRKMVFPREHHTAQPRLYK